MLVSCRQAGIFVPLWRLCQQFSDLYLCKLLCVVRAARICILFHCAKRASKSGHVPKVECPSSAGELACCATRARYASNYLTYVNAGLVA